MASPNAHHADTDLVSAVIAFAKDPSKYSSYLNDIRKEIETLEKQTAKYHSFKDAEEFIKLEMIKLEDLSKMLGGLKQTLDGRTEQLNLEQQNFNKIRNEVTIQNKKEALQIAEDKTKLEFAKKEVALEQQRVKEYAVTLQTRTVQMNEREAKFNQRFAALQDLMRQ